MATPIQTGVVQSASGSSTANNATAFASNLTVGNYVVATIALSGSTNNPTPTVTAVNCGIGNTLSLVTGATVTNGSGTTGIHVEIWAGQVAGAGHQNFNIQCNAACNIEGAAAEYDGKLYTVTLDGAVVTNTGTSTGPASGNLTTATEDLLIFAAGWNRAQGAWTTGPTNSFVSEISENAAGSGTGKNATGASGVNLNDRVVSATGTYSSAGTIGGSVAWATIILGFQQTGVTTGTATGTATVSGVGAALFEAVGASTGTATVSGVGLGLGIGTGSATGVATVTGVGLGLGIGTGSATGTATVSGVGLGLGIGTGISDGLALVLGVGAATAEAVGEATGVAIVLGVSGAGPPPGGGDAIVNWRERGAY